MRMDNETFRLKVENLFGSLRSAQGDGYDRAIMAELEQLAATPRKSRYFLKAVAAQEDPGLQEHFYRLIFSRVRSDQEAGDLERHIRHMFYTDREEAKAMLARVATRGASRSFSRHRPYRRRVACRRVDPDRPCRAPGRAV